MRRSSARKIFKIMSPDDRARVFEANARVCHPRIAIGIDEIDLSAEKNVTVIRASCDKNQGADENDFRKEGKAPPHVPFYSEIRNRKSEISWARQDSNLGPRDYESPALTAELQARSEQKVKHSKCHMTTPESFRGRTNRFGKYSLLNQNAMKGSVSTTFTRRPST